MFIQIKENSFAAFSLSFPYQHCLYHDDHCSVVGLCWFGQTRKLTGQQEEEIESVADAAILQRATLETFETFDQTETSLLNKMTAKTGPFKKSIEMADQRR